jgi:hypothetical protein
VTALDERPPALLPPAAEVWRVVARAPLYEVSSHGRVRRIGGRVLRDQPSGAGYRKVHLGRRCQALVHALVAEAFHGPRPPGHDVDHKDWDRTHNHASNLRWLPAPENRCRWAGPGRHDFEVLTKHTPPPDDFEPMTPAEESAVLDALHAAGWGGSCG